MKKLLAVCSFCLLVAGCAHQGAGYGSAGGFEASPECITDSAYSLGSTYSLGPTYGYAAAGDSYDGFCRNGGRRIHSYSSPEATSAIAQRASVVGHTRPRPEPRVITRPGPDAAPSASSSVGTGSGSGLESGSGSGSSSGSGSGSGFAGPGPSAPASPAPAAPSVSASPGSRPHSN